MKINIIIFTVINFASFQLSAQQKKEKQTTNNVILNLTDKNTTYITNTKLAIIKDKVLKKRDSKKIETKYIGGKRLEIIKMKIYKKRKRSAYKTKYITGEKLKAIKQKVLAIQ